MTLQKSVRATPWSAAIANHDLPEVDRDAESRRLMLERFQTEVRVSDSHIFRDSILVYLSLPFPCVASRCFWGVGLSVVQTHVHT